MLTRAAAILTLLVGTGTGLAVDGTYVNNLDGNYSDTGNWVAGTVASGSGATATMTGTLGAPRLITLDIPVTLQNILFQNTGQYFDLTGANTLTLAGGTAELGSTNQADISVVIAGSENVEKTGDGILLLSGTNTYTGSTTIAAGTLRVQGAVAESTDGPLGNSASAVVIGTGSADASFQALQAGNYNIDRDFSVDAGGTGKVSIGAYHNSFTINFTGDVSMPRDIELEGNLIGSTTIFSGVLSGAGSITKTGAAELRLTNTNTYTGSTTVSAGSLSLYSNVAVSTDGPLGNSATALVLGDGNTGNSDIKLTIANGTTFDRDIVVTDTGGTGSVRFDLLNNVTGSVINGDIQVNRDVLIYGNDNSPANVINGVISGAGNVTFERQVRLTGSNTYTGTTTIQSLSTGYPLSIVGDVLVNTDGPLGNSDTAIKLLSGALLQVGGGNINRDIDASTGTVGVNINGSGGILMLNGDLITGNRQFGGGAAEYHGVISGPGSFRTAYTGGYLGFFNPANTFSGDVSANIGFIRVGADAPAGGPGALGTGTTPVWLNSTSNNAHDTGIYTTVAATVGRDIDIDAGGPLPETYVGTLFAGESTFSGTIDLINAHDSLDLDVVTNGTVNITGQVTGLGDLVKWGNGLAVLGNSANDYPGTTVVTNGTLAASANGAFGDLSAGTSNNSGGSIGFIGGVNYTDLEALTVTGTGEGGSGAIKNVSGNNRFHGPITLVGNATFGADADKLNIKGTISGSNALTITTASGAAVEISSDNSATYSGSVIVTNGKLLVGNTVGSATGSGSVAVNTGGILGGNGIVGGPVAINAGGIIAPGNSAGDITVDNNLTFAGSSSIFQFELLAQPVGFDFDTITVNGLVDLGGTAITTGAQMTVTLTSPVQKWQKLFIVVNDDTDAITGEFLGKPNGALITLTPGNFARISYFGDSGSNAVTGGNDIVLYDFSTAIPEPATMSLLVLGGLMIGKRSHKSRKA